MVRPAPDIAKNMNFFPSMTTLMATSTEAAATIAAFLPSALWIAGIGIAGVLLAWFLGLPGLMWDTMMYRPDGSARFGGALHQGRGTGTGSGVNSSRAMKRGGYERFYDPVKGQMYWKNGSSRIWIDD